MEIIQKILAKKADVTGGNPITIAFFGDSVTQGCFELYKTGENSFETEFRVEDGYHTRLREYLQILYPSVPINMIFAGISGDNASSGLARVERDICAFHPDLTVFCFGLNDCCCGLERLQEYKDSIRGIIDALKGCGTEIIFMTPNLMADSVSPEVTDAYIRKCYAEMIAVSNETLETFVQAAKEVCRESGVTVCDCYAAWKRLKDNGADVVRLLSNRINHPTRELQRLFAVMLLDTILGK